MSLIEERRYDLYHKSGVEVEAVKASKMAEPKVHQVLSSWATLTRPDQPQASSEADHQVEQKKAQRLQRDQLQLILLLPKRDRCMQLSNNVNFNRKCQQWKKRRKKKRSTPGNYNNSKRPSNLLRRGKVGKDPQARSKVLKKLTKIPKKFNSMIVQDKAPNPSISATCQLTKFLRKAPMENEHFEF